MHDHEYVKRCTCCGALYTLTAWRELPLLGHQDDEDAQLELRNCPCPAGATLYLRVDQGGKPVPDPEV